MAREEVILLFWDCPECGHAHIPGPTQRCPNCFWWRDRGVEFYEAPDSRVLTPEEVAQYQGPDWICKVCGAANPERGEPVANLICGNCQQWQTNSLDLGEAAPEDLASGMVVVQKSGTWEEGFHLPPETESDTAESLPRQGFNWRKYRNVATVGIVGFASCGVLWGAWQAIAPRSIEAEIVSRDWVVSVEIQEQRPVAEGGWSVPSDAYHVRSSQRQRGTRQVQTGTRTEQVQVAYQEQTGTREECKTVSRGDGTGTRSCQDVPVYETRYRTETKEVPVYTTEPVYDTWYDYTVDRWQTLRTVEERGTDAMSRRAPAVSLSGGSYPLRTLEPQETCRVGVRYQRRQAVKVETWTLPCAQYDQLTMGQTVTFKRSFGGTTLQGAE